MSERLLNRIHTELHGVIDGVNKAVNLIIAERKLAARRHAEILSFLNRPKATLTFGDPQPKKELPNE